MTQVPLTNTLHPTDRNNQSPLQARSMIIWLDHLLLLILAPNTIIQAVHLLMGEHMTILAVFPVVMVEMEPLVLVLA
jgi:hypothetical protein